jgi:hypothetical protein
LRFLVWNFPHFYSNFYIIKWIYVYLNVAHDFFFEQSNQRGRDIGL